MINNSKKFHIPLPVKLLVVVLLCLFFGEYLNPNIKSIFFAISCSIKTILTFFLPVIIFSYLFACLISFEQGAIVFVISIITLVCCSNFLTAWISYFVGNAIFNGFCQHLEQSGDVHRILAPMWSFKLPALVKNEHALFSGLILGCFFAYRPSLYAKKIGNALKLCADFFLNKLFIPVVPLFVLGYVLELEYKGQLVSAFKSYGPILGIVAATEFVYIGILYAIGAKFSIFRWATFIKNIFPSAITGFSTMSSAATLPVTMKGAELNTRDPELAKAIIPTTCNIHMIGDGIAICMLAMAMFVTFGHPIPSIPDYFIFSLYFVLAKFAVAGVPGGGVIAIIPVLEAHLGFQPAMISLITAIYIMFDPITTTANVTGNGAFAIIFAKIYKLIEKVFLKKAHECSAVQDDDNDQESRTA